MERYIGLDVHASSSTPARDPNVHRERCRSPQRRTSRRVALRNTRWCLAPARARPKRRGSTERWSCERGGTGPARFAAGSFRAPTFCERDPGSRFFLDKLEEVSERICAIGPRQYPVKGGQAVSSQRGPPVAATRCASRSPHPRL